MEALTEAQAEWNKEWVGRKEVSKEWDSVSSFAYELRDRLQVNFRFAFRGYPKLLQNLQSNPQRKNHPTMIQDLNDLAVLGRMNQPLLAAIGFDMALLDRAAQLSADLSGLLAKTTISRVKLSESKKIRDQAYTYLKTAVDQIRRTGQFVFRGDKKHCIVYISDHLLQTRQRQKRKSKNKPS